MKLNAKKITLFLTCLAPVGLMLYDLLADRLGAEPVAAMRTITGLWTLRFLLFTLAITPIRQRLGFNFIHYRRMLGLYAFFYALLHLLIYIIFEESFDFSAIIADVLERPFIFVGMASFLLLIPLVITSTKGMMKRLGKRWKTLHKLVYLIMCLGLLHFFWVQKSDYSEPLLYTAIFIGLLLLRKSARKTLRQRNPT
ncbi:MAG: sulfite oxidase heme-binding subunit YedZ [Ostreibacterium sp.]